MFEKTGYLLTVDGSGGHLVQLQGLRNYHVPPPTIIGPTSHFIISSVPEVEIVDVGYECHHDIESDEEENYMLVEEKIETDDENIFEIFED